MLQYLEEVRHMSKTVVRKNESLDDALRRFKRSVIISETDFLAVSNVTFFLDDSSISFNLR